MAKIYTEKYNRLVGNSMKQNKNTHTKNPNPDKEHKKIKKSKVMN